MLRRTIILFCVIAAGAVTVTAAQDRPAATSELRDDVERYATDRAALLRRYDVGYAPARQARMATFYDEWRGRLRGLDFDALGLEGKVDYVLLDHELAYQQALLTRDGQWFAEMTPWLPFAPAIMDLAEARRRMEVPDGRQAAETLTALAARVDSVRKAVTAAGGTGDARRDRIVGRRAAGMLGDLQRAFRNWHRFYAGYDPLFTWWTAEPFRLADSAIGAYLGHLNRTVVGVRPGEADPIIGDPIGVAGLRADLVHEMIPYTVEELIAIAEREFAWCEAEYRKAAREMGLGDDWRAALERVKRAYVPPGDQTRLVRDLANEAITFVEARNLVTVPPLAREVWRMEMIPPERQRVSPFFLGGEVFQVSYPTDEMTHEDKLMSMRGNNPHFSRAVAHHELIPGHHLQGFMTSRYQTHRRVFGTPFWGEGWALYWEMLLWDLGFPATPEDRIGMLFWRSHRAARIIFSLRFHAGTMTPQEAVDLLVNRVGHERANAEGEVRRSLAGDYSPLYQAAYMLGGLQFRALHREMVGSGRMTDRVFHDAILQGGRMPVEMVRARLTGTPPARDHRAGWRFAGDPGRP
ncbi:MAG TPA: DUF885 family protein [Gemmatimonadales bacterium]|jgi:hypothetical protein